MQNVDWVAERKETPRTARRRKRSSSSRRDAVEHRLQVSRETMSPRLNHRRINIRGVRGEEEDQEPWHP